MAFKVASYWIEELTLVPLQVYTDEGHCLKGSVYHLYKTIEWFLDESFGPLENGDWEPTGFFAFKQ